ncbi:MAG: hypothetical protein ACXV74_03680 [Methylobacter sp.]
MTRNNLTAQGNEKSQAPCEQPTFITPFYRKLLNAAHNGHFFEKMLHIRRFLPTGKNRSVLLPILFILSGCAAAPITPPSAKISEVRKILVASVESPPLEVIPDLIENRFPVYNQFQYQAMPSHLYLDEKIYQHSGGILIAGMVSKDEAVPAANMQPTSPDASLPGNWTPTLALAQEAVAQLNGDRIKARLSKQPYRLPMASKDRNANLGNWHNAIERWYGQDTSSVDYRPSDLEQVDALLEVGIGTYRIFNAQTSLQVLIKLIDPKTRQVIGRISAKTFSAEDSPQTLLNHDAEKFKELVTLMGTQLLTRAFGDLGLPLDTRVSSSQSKADKITL